MNDHSELSGGVGNDGAQQNEGTNIEAQQNALRDTLFAFVDKMYPITGLPVVEEFLVQNQLDVQIDKRKTYKATLMELIKCCYPKDSDVHEYYDKENKTIRTKDIVSDENRPMFKVAESILINIAMSGKNSSDLVDPAWFDNQKYFPYIGLGDSKSCSHAFTHVVGHAYTAIRTSEIEYDQKDL